ncbi:MAG TPA: primosomal protein N', partial [Desulfobacteraceae bacterium]|nr:primosomal protein N' [Desulfobacteraceae bacterium]
MKIDIFVFLWSNRAMETSHYIEVAVAVPVHGTYTYRAPEHLDRRAEPGMRVLVPFGRRRITGYILSRNGQHNGYTVKNILDLLDERPLFPRTMVPLFRWVADYYIHPIGEVIKTALPVGLNRYDVSCVSLTPRGISEQERGSLLPGESALVDILAHKKPLSLKAIAA